MAARISASATRSGAVSGVVTSAVTRSRRVNERMELTSWIMYLADPAASSSGVSAGSVDSLEVDDADRAGSSVSSGSAESPPGGAQRPNSPAAIAVAIGKGRTAEPVRVDSLAFKFMGLAVARGAEVRGAVWNEMDQGSGVWAIPASRIKTAREHWVPLCGRALENSRSGAEAERLNRLLRRYGTGGGTARFPVVVPGLGRRGDRVPARGCKAALAYKVRNQIEAA